MPFSLKSMADADCDTSDVALQAKGGSQVAAFVTSYSGRCRPAVQAGQQLSTAVLCTT